MSIDCKVNVLDLIKVRNNLNKDAFQNGVAGDVNGDGKINVLDLIHARNQIGWICSPLD